MLLFPLKRLNYEPYLHLFKVLLCLVELIVDIVQFALKVPILLLLILEHLLLLGVFVVLPLFEQILSRFIDLLQFLDRLLLFFHQLIVLPLFLDHLVMFKLRDFVL
jgi:hypothetical protein